jgi:hypothetical protein
MDKNKAAFNAIESAFFVAQAACFPDQFAKGEDEIFFHELPENVQAELMKAQKNICADFGVKPEDISMVGDDNTFIYSVESFL